MRGVRDTRRWQTGILRAVLGYAFFAALWILVSDRVAGWLFRDPDVLVRVGTLKGWAFVVVTSLLLYGLLRRSWRVSVGELEERARALSLLESISESSDDAIFAKDPEGRYLLFNRAASEFSGKPAAEVLGKDDRALFPLDQAEMLMAMGRRVLEEDRTIVAEEVLDTPAGRRVFLATKGPLHGADGRPFGIFGISRDITEQKRAERALRESERRFQDIVNVSADWTWEVDVDARYTFVSDSVRDLLGYAPEEIVGKTPFDLMPPEEAQRVRVEFEAIAAEKRPFRDLDNINVHKDGSLRHIWTNGMPILGHDGELLGYRGMDRDVTRTKRTEEMLRSTNELLTLFLTHSPVYAFIKEVTPTQSRVLIASENYQDMVGIPGSKMAGMTMEELFPPEFAAKMTADDWTVVSGGRMLQLDEDLGGRHYTTIKFPITVGERNLLAGYTIDITERKRAESERVELEGQLRQSQKMEAIGTLAGGIAHDFNNILTPVMAHADLALMKLGKDDPVREDIVLLLQAAQRAAELVHQILVISRREPGEPRVSVHLESIVKETAKFLRASLPATIQIELEVDPTCGAVLADPSQLHQVLLNLCTNAAYAMKEKGGVLAIALDRAEDPGGRSRIRLRVKDTGEGMSGDVVGRIFEPYFTTKPTGEGSGLGLAVVHGIVTKHGGDVRVESTAGQGTTVDVFLPEMETGEVPVDAPRVAPPRGRGQSVLVVDDEPSVRDVLSKMLSALGYRVTEAAGGEEALSTFLSTPEAFDAVITDYTMPGRTGLDLAGDLLARRADLPILLATGYAESVSDAFSKERGLRGVLRKPYTLLTLGEALQRLFRSS